MCGLYGEEGLSNNVADISASIICPGVISMGIPKLGVTGRSSSIAAILSMVAILSMGAILLRLVAILSRPPASGHSTLSSILSEMAGMGDGVRDSLRGSGVKDTVRGRGVLESVMCLDIVRGIGVWDRVIGVCFRDTGIELRVWDTGIAATVGVPLRTLRPPSRVNKVVLEGVETGRTASSRRPSPPSTSINR